MNLLELLLLFVLLICTSGLILLCYMRYEAGTLTIERIDLSEAATALTTNNLRAVQFSDIHIPHLKISTKKIIAALNEIQPHIVLLTGDYIEKVKDMDRFLLWLKVLIDSQPSQTAFYLCFGNHDYFACKKKSAALHQFIKRLKSIGVFVLENHSELYSHNGKKYAITGFRDLRCSPLNISGALRSIDPTANYRIGLAHNPDTVLMLQNGIIDLLLCGHFHGGQIWLPFHLEFTCLRPEKLCKMKIYHGLHLINGIKLYISRGIGCVLFPLRFRSKPEITFFTLP